MGKLAEEIWISIQRNKGIYTDKWAHPLLIFSDARKENREGRSHEIFEWRIVGGFPIIIRNDSTNRSQNIYQVV
jgi:hypothetical protein